MDTLVFFFDRTFGTKLPQALLSLKCPALIKWHQGEGFAHDTPDDVWMNVVGPRKWICLSQDRKWQHAMKCFYLPNEHRWLTLCKIAARHQKIMEISHKLSGPFVFELKANRQLYPVKLP